MGDILINKSFKSLGTEIKIWIIGGEKSENKVRLTIDKLENFYRQKEKILSRFNPESELSRLNKNIGKFQKASEDIAYLSFRSLGYNKFSQGFFDPRILEIMEKIGYEKDFYATDFSKKNILCNISEKFGDLKDDLKIKKDEILFNKKMDFSGIAKGYITDKAVDFLEKKGYKNFLVDSGGDIFASGKNEKGSSWRISLEGFPESEFLAELSGQGVATSGISRRKWENNGKKYHHLVNPKSPEHFSFDLKSATVISDTTEQADVYAKVLFLMGKEEGLKFAEANGLAGLFLDCRGNLVVSSKAKSYIKL